VSDNSTESAVPEGTTPPPAPEGPTTTPPAPAYGAPAAYPGAPAQPGYAAPTQPPYATPAQPGYAAPAQPPAYGAAAPYPQGQYSGYPVAPKTNTLAIVSLVSSLVGIFIIPFIGSIVGVITGHMSLSQLKTNGEGGRGLALAGTIVGWVGIGFSILGLIAIIFFISVAAQTGVRYGS
jgi:hypothetical protein